MKKTIKSTPNVKQAVPFFWVKDMARSLEFYVNGLRFKRKDSWEVDGQVRWCWLELGGVALMLQAFWEDGPHQNATNERLGVGVSIYFVCEDALVIYQELTSRGIIVKEPFVGNGMWVVGLEDPDGYVLYFESETEVAEGTTYSNWLIEN